MKLPVNISKIAFAACLLCPAVNAKAKDPVKPAAKPKAGFHLPWLGKKVPEPKVKAPKVASPKVANRLRIPSASQRQASAAPSPGPTPAPAPASSTPAPNFLLPPNTVDARNVLGAGDQPPLPDNPGDGGLTQVSVQEQVLKALAAKGNEPDPEPPVTRTDALKLWQAQQQQQQQGHK